MERTVPETMNGERVDKAIVGLFEGSSRAKVKKAIEAGEVRVNGRRVPKGGVVNAGDVIAIEGSVLGGSEATCLPDPSAPLHVVHESATVLVVDKPAGQPTAPLRDGELGTLANALVARYPELAGIGYSSREPGIVHRLDTGTSGLVVVARTAAAFEALRDALQGERLHKSYLLICASEGLPDEGTIEYPITNHPKDKKRVYPCIHPRDVMRYAPRPALTTYRVEERKGPWALVRAEAPRAIRHQLRAHFAALEHPLVGDVLYGGPVVPGLERHALHAAHVSFAGDGDPALVFDVSVPLPPDLAAVLA